MDVKFCSKVFARLAFTTILTTLTLDTTAMAQEITQLIPSISPANENTPETTDSILFFLIIIGAYLYLINSRSI